MTKTSNKWAKLKDLSGEIFHFCIWGKFSVTLNTVEDKSTQIAHIFNEKEKYKLAQIKVLLHINV